MTPFHDGPVVKGKRASYIQQDSQRYRHDDCLFCDLIEGHLQKSILANGRLRLEVMDHKIEAKRYRKVLLEHTNLAWVRELLGLARCSHGISLQGRCSRCGAVEEGRREHP